MAYIPFKERLWCSVDETCLVTGEGRTIFFAKISAGEIVSKLEGRRRLVHVPSLIAKYDVLHNRLEEEKHPGSENPAIAARDARLRPDAQ